MSTVKTKVDSNEVLAFLQEHFDKSTVAIEFIKGGEMSQAFSFDSKGRGYVIRINSKKYSFEKDKYAFEHFRNGTIPIPEVIEIGKFSEKYFYAISQKAVGVNFDELDLATREKLVPQVITILDAIHKCNIDPEGNYGLWDENGKAALASWKEYILSYKEETLSAWNERFSVTFFEKNLLEITFKRIEELIVYAPEERYLVHSDYGFNNLVSNGGRITAVLDWGEGRYGDFLYDVAWLEFYSTDIKFADSFETYYKEQGSDIPHYKERIRCYQLYVGLTGCGFFALSEQKEPYLWAKQRLLSLAQ